MVARQIRQLMSWHAATRAPFSSPLNNFCRRYVIAWSNPESDRDSNGERWLVETIAKRAPKTGAVFLDASTDVGGWSRLVLDHVPGARLIAFEPSPPVREPLAADVVGGGAEVLPYALSNETGSTGRTDAVQRRIGDDVCAELGISHIRFLKVDAGGHDLKVIEGFRNLIDSGGIDVIQFEYNHMSIFSRTFLRDYFNALTPQMRIARLLRDRIEFFDYVPPLDNFIQANFIAVRADLAEGELAFLSRR